MIGRRIFAPTKRGSSVRHIRVETGGLYLYCGRTADSFFGRADDHEAFTQTCSQCVRALRKELRQRERSVERLRCILSAAKGADRD